MSDNLLNTTVLPKYNCSNCKHFLTGKKKEIVKVDSLPEGNQLYAVECDNVVHPLLDCVLRGFEAHSDQPGFSQTLNK